jgi:hypothetical protein
MGLAIATSAGAHHEPRQDFQPGALRRIASTTWPQLVSRLTNAEVRSLHEPAQGSLPDNELVIHNEGNSCVLGLNPIRLSEGLLYEVYEMAARYR